jgi:ATP-dependent exoDNAse (exonuclease V) beta subunit
MAELDARQQAAVDAGPTDLFISAGAGSGKTRVLTERFVRAVLGAPPYVRSASDSLLTITYTEKAAGELSERIRTTLLARGCAAEAREVGDAWISTIHGMCSRIVRRYAFAAGIDPGFAVLDEVEATALEMRVLDAVVSEATAADPEALALFDAWDYDTVVRAARHIRASVRALGLDTDDIARLTDADIGRVLARTHASFAGLREEIAALGDRPAVFKNAERARTSAETLGAALKAGPPYDADALDCGTQKLGWRRDCRIDGLDPLVEAARALAGEVHDAVNQLRAGVHEEAFLRLLGTYAERFEAAKRVRGALDFEDLQVVTARLLEAHPEIAAELRAGFRMVMIDEFQDTNALQLGIINRLSLGNLCTVGDESQSIYSFRHADVEVFRARARDVTERHELDTNYRVEPSLLAGLTALFGHPALLGPGSMRLRPPGSAPPRAPWPSTEPRLQTSFLVSGAGTQVMPPLEAEAECIADHVAGLVSSGVGAGDIAVLLRAVRGGRAAAVERALAGRGIPATLSAGGEFFECPEVGEARTLLAVIDNVLDDAALVALLAGRFVGLGADALFALRTRADALAVDAGQTRSRPYLWSAVTDPPADLSAADASVLANLVSTIHDARRRRGLRPLAETLIEPLLALDADLTLFASGPEGPRRWSNIRKLARLAEEYESATGGDVTGFLAYLDERALYSVGEGEATLDTGLGAVRIMSIHAAKGLEFPAVIVGGLGSPQPQHPILVGRRDGRPLLAMKLPVDGGRESTTAWSSAADALAAAEAAETKRLLYVAFTRAEESLAVVASTDISKDADNTPAGLLRQALGAAAPGALSEGDHRIGEGTVHIRLVEPREPVTRPAAGSPCGAPPAGPAAAPAVAAGPHLGTGSLSLAPPRVSYSALALYEGCPYRFYLTNIVRMPEAPSSGAEGVFALGSALHAVLERLTSPDDDPAPLVERAAAAAGLSEALVPRLERAVAGYLALPVAAEAFACERVGREVPITVPVGGTVLVGAVDLVARAAAGDMLIVDYKTGADALEIGVAEDRYRLQGRCYALAALCAGAPAARVVFAEVERGRQVEFRYTARDRAALERSIAEPVIRMSAGAYEPRAAYERALCESCPGFRGMCPVTPTRRDAAE